MPLYDYLCSTCGETATLLVGLDAEAPACPRCAESTLTKQLSLFAIGGKSGAVAESSISAAGATPRRTGCAAPGHVHGAGCRGGSPSSGKEPAGCSPYTDSVVKKYLPD